MAAVACAVRWFVKIYRVPLCRRIIRRRAFWSGLRSCRAQVAGISGTARF